MSTIGPRRRAPRARSAGARNARSTQAAWATRTRPAIASSSASAASAERRRRGQVRLPQPVDPHRGGRHAVHRPGQALARAAEHDPPAVDRDGAPRDDRVASRVEPGGLQVHHAEGGLPPRRAARRPARTAVGVRRGAGAPHRAPTRSSAPIRRCTPATARNASFSELRVSGLSAAGVEEVVGLLAGLELRRPGGRAAGRRSARSASSSMRRVVRVERAGLRRRAQPRGRRRRSSRRRPAPPSGRGRRSGRSRRA